MGVPSCCIWQDRFQVGGTSFVEAKPEASEVQPTTWAPQCSSHPRRLATVEPKGHDVIEQQNTDAWFDDAGEVRLSQYTDRGAPRPIVTATDTLRGVAIKLNQPIRKLKRPKLSS
jgi:hypothetical protein